MFGATPRVTLENAGSSTTTKVEVSHVMTGALLSMHSVRSTMTKPMGATMKTSPRVLKQGH